MHQVVVDKTLFRKENDDHFKKNDGKQVSDDDTFDAMNEGG